MRLNFVLFVLLFIAGVLIQLPQAFLVFISPDYQSVIEKQPASAYCNTSGLPNATVAWFKESKPNVVLSRNHTLIFTRILRANEGRYICNASYGNVSLTGSISFNVTYPPENLQINISMNTVLENSTLTIECTAQGNPAPNVSFAKEGKSATPTKWSQEIRFGHIKRTDSGNYTCRADNGIGSINETRNLDVQYPPEFSPMPKVRDSWLHDEVELVCNASGNPVPTITWRRPNAEPINNSKVLRFNVTNETQFGVYHCDAQNKHGNEPFSMLLNRTRFAPDPPIITNNVSTVTSRNFTLEWAKPNEHNSNISQYCVTRTRFFHNGSIDEWESYNHDALLPLNMSFFLDWGTTYRFAVSAENRQGDSGAGPPKNITVIAERKVSSSKTHTGRIALAMIFGVGAGVVLIIVIAIVIVCYKRRDRSRPPPPCPKPQLQTQFQEPEETLPQRSIFMKELSARFPRKLSKDRYTMRHPPFNEDEESQDILNETHVSYVNTATTEEPAQSAIYDNLESVHKSIESWEIPRERVRIEKIIGKGAFCQVAKAFVEGIGTVAVKMIREKAGMESNRKDLLAEYELLQHLGQHPNVVLVLGGVTVTDPIMILFEYVPYGDLLGYLRRSRGLNDTYYNDPDEKPASSLTSQQLMRFSREIAEGMAFLSGKKIVHRDLAARNVLVCQGEMCKITDFGMARDVANNEIYQKRTRGRLPVKWTAYEALLYGLYTTQSDVWSYGIVLYETFTIGGCPYPDQDGRRLAQLIQNGYRMPKPKHVDKEIYALMSECWRTEPERRPTFNDVVRTLKRLERHPKDHIFMNQYEKNLYENLDDL